MLASCQTWSVLSSRMPITMFGGQRRGRWSGFDSDHRVSNGRGRMSLRLASALGFYAGWPTRWAVTSIWSNVRKRAPVLVRLGAHVP